MAETPLIVQHLSTGFRALFVLDDQWWRRPEGGAAIHELHLTEPFPVTLDPAALLR